MTLREKGRKSAALIYDVETKIAIEILIIVASWELGRLSLARRKEKGLSRRKRRGLESAAQTNMALS